MFGIAADCHRFLSPTCGDVVFDACMHGCEQKRATRVRRFPSRWFRRLAVCCDGQHVHKFECANNVDNFITRSQYPVALCHVLVDIMDSHCLVVRLAPPPSASSRLVDDIRISVGVRQRERRRPLLLPEFKEVFVVNVPSDKVAVVSNSINKTPDVRCAFGSACSAQRV